MAAETTKPRVGILATALELYETLVPELRAQREQWVKDTLLPALATIADVRFSRAVFRSEEMQAVVADHERDDVDLLLVICLTYSPSQAVATLNPSEIQAIGISSQGGALQLLDADGQPIGSVISWLDARGRPFDDQITAALGEEFLAEHIGRRRSAMTGGQILRLRQQVPELLEMPNKIGFVGDVIVGRLCGRRAHDATSLSIAPLLNPSLGRADPEWLEYLGIREEQLPELLPITAPAGPLGAEPARQTGLPEGIPVSAAIHDQYAAAIGSGSVGEGDICLGTGTAWVLVANTGNLAARSPLRRLSVRTLSKDFTANCCRWGTADHRFSGPWACWATPDGPSSRSTICLKPCRQEAMGSVSGPCCCQSGNEARLLTWEVGCRASLSLTPATIYAARSSKVSGANWLVT